MRKIIPGEIPTRDLHQFLLASVSPRPIAFVSTVNEEGIDNLAPYSFFNCFSSNPPILVFSSNRRVSNNTTKDTLSNIISQKECVVNVVSYPIVRQMTLASIEFPSDTSEFEKSGLTPIASEFVKPKRVKESPVQMECKVNDIITLGEHGGAGHLIICEVVAMHIREDIIDPENNRIDPNKIDLMGRMGRSYYVRASGDAIHSIFQAVTEITVGYDALPEHVKKSNILTANEIAILGGIPVMPSLEEVKEAESFLEGTDPKDLNALHALAKKYISEGDKISALKICLLRE